MKKQHRKDDVDGKDFVVPKPLIKIPFYQNNEWKHLYASNCCYLLQ